MPGDKQLLTLHLRALLLRTRIQDKRAQIKIKTITVKRLLYTANKIDGSN